MCFWFGLNFGIINKRLCEKDDRTDCVSYIPTHTVRCVGSVFVCLALPSSCTFYICIYRYTLSYIEGKKEIFILYVRMCAQPNAINRSKLWRACLSLSLSLSLWAYWIMPERERLGLLWLLVVWSLCALFFTYISFLRLATSIYIYIERESGSERERDIYQLASLLAVFATWDNEENVNPLRSTVKFDISQPYLST